MNQLPGNKRMIDIPLPSSLFLNPEDKNPDLEQLRNKPNIAYHFPFSQTKLF